MSLIKMASKSLDVSKVYLSQRIDALERTLKDGARISERTVEISHTPTPTFDISQKVVSEVVESEAEFSNKNLISQYWPRVLQSIKSAKISLHAVLADTKPIFKSDSEIVIEIKDGFNFHKTQVDANIDFITDIISKIANKNFKVSSSIGSGVGVDEVKKEAKSDIHKNFVKNAMDIFGGKI